MEALTRELFRDPLLRKYQIRRYRAGKKRNRISSKFYQKEALTAHEQSLVRTTHLEADDIRFINFDLGEMRKVAQKFVQDGSSRTWPDHERAWTGMLLWNIQAALNNTFTDRAIGDLGSMVIAYLYETGSHEDFSIAAFARWYELSR